MNDDFEFDESEYPFPQKPKRDDPRKRKGHPFTWIEVWLRAVTQPDVGVYREHLADPQASLMRALTWVFVASVAGSLMQAIAASMPRLGGPGMIGFNESFDINVSLMSTLCCAPFFAVFGMVAFVIWNGIQYLFAVMLGGEGTFEDQLYSAASFAAPISLIMTFSGMIPCIGPLAMFGVLLYMLYLNIIALDATHLFGQGKAIIVSLWWVLLFCLCPLVLLTLLIMAGVTSSIF